MDLNVTVETGDVTVPESTLRRAGATSYSLDQFYLVELDDVASRLTPTQWNALRVAVASPSTAQWRQGAVAPFDDPALQQLAGVIDTTPSFQLFLAAVEILDILETLVLPAPASPKELRNVLAGTFSDIATHAGRQKGLYFIPLETCEALTQQVAEELVLSNKLCRLRIVIGTDDVLQTYYVPYATPVSSAGDFSQDAYSVWRKIRAACRAATRSFEQ
ncbi:MAG: hypothetical protein HN341_05125 [Verrucomicrobia bacterium]|jgi:hypothetical protein|nr:hypothetical protein [Verrucomicrobiota bacterium]